MKKENHSETNPHHMPIGMAIGSVVDSKQRKKGENDPEKKD